MRVIKSLWICVWIVMSIPHTNGWFNAKRGRRLSARRLIKQSDLVWALLSCLL